MVRMVICVGFLFSAAIVSPEFALTNQQSIPIARGQIIEKVVCEDKPEQSYAVYLPANYDPARRWPILYAFDPGARGQLPVERYREAAEKFGWIVAGSNNSRNAAWQVSVDAWNAMTADTHKRFSIDDRRMYVTGFSGGARVAIALAIACGDCIEGVIASGAGFPPSISPSPAIHFAYFGTTGTNDFNFPEVKTLEAQLTKANIASQIEVFEGGHDWPPSQVAIDAVAWMGLRAMQSGKLSRDDEFVSALWNLKAGAARTFEGAGRLYDAYQVYAGMSKSFKGLRDVTEAETRTRLLGNKAEVRDAIRDEEQQIKKQRQFENQIRTLIQAAGRAPLRAANGASDSEGTQGESLDPRIRLHQILVELRRQSKAAEDSGHRRVARRVLEGQFIGLFEEGAALLRSGEQRDETVRAFALATEVNPDRPGAYYYLAWAYAAKGDKKKALQALQTAVDKGYSDLTAITGNKVFDSLRTEKQYEEIIGRMQKP